MKSRALWAAVAAALIFGALGYYYGISSQPPEPYAAPATVTAPPAADPTCRASALVVYDTRQTPAFYVVAGPAKQIDVEYPASSPADWGVCWNFEVREGPVQPFKSLKVVLTRNQGRHSRPILTGDPNFKGNRGVRLRFDDEPLWSGPNNDQHVMGYEVRGKLHGAADELVADPDIVIQKPRG